MTVRARTTRSESDSGIRIPLVLIGLALAFLEMACSGSPVGPTPVEAVPVAAQPAPSASASTVRAMPAGLDPAYVLALSTATPDGRPKVWVGGPFHHCPEAGIDPQIVARVAALMSAVSGIPQTDQGPCNVEWAINPDLYGTTTAARSVLTGSANAITHARIEFSVPYYQNRAVHEAGHVLGLSHSPRPEDIMVENGHDHDFTRAELAVLAWMYGR